MDLGTNRVYEFEAWTAAGIKVADISNVIHNRSYTLERNEAEQLTFDMDINDIERLASAMNVNPRNIIAPYQTDVRVKRNGQYYFAAQVVAVTFNLTNDPATMTEGQVSTSAASFSPSVTVTCTGYLNLFKDRYISATYTATEATTIATNLITAAQALTNGSVGATINASQYATGVLRDRTYARDNVKTSLQNLTQLVDGRFDFAFDYNKVFTTYSQIGSTRTDIAFTYGSSDSNIAGLYLERSATNLFNEIIGLGSGFGTDQLVSTQDDLVSQAANFLRQDIKQYNSVTLQPTLDQNARADLMLEKDLLEIPQVTITGNELRGKTFLSVGDRIPVKVKGHPFLDNINGLYRIEKMVVTLDDNDFEQSIVLYFDNYAVTS